MNFNSSGYKDNLASVFIFIFLFPFSRPDKAVLGIWGDFDSTQMLTQIETYFGDWEFQGENEGESPFKLSEVQEDGISTMPAGLYLVDRPGLTQGYNGSFFNIKYPFFILEDFPNFFLFLTSYVRMGEFGISLNNPDVYPLEVLDSILNGFGGRLFDQVHHYLHKIGTDKKKIAFTHFPLFSLCFPMFFLVFLFRFVRERGWPIPFLEVSLLLLNIRFSCLCFCFKLIVVFMNKENMSGIFCGWWRNSIVFSFKVNLCIEKSS